MCSMFIVWLTWTTQTGWRFDRFRKEKKIQKELKELEKTIYPKYQETVSILKVQRADLDKNSKKWKHKQNIGTEK